MGFKDFKGKGNLFFSFRVFPGLCMWCVTKVLDVLTGL